MLYFIPAWYQQNKWSENEQIWYERRMYTEFDDTVKQIQLFHRSKACRYQIILLGYAPNFRHFLHRQSVYRAPYWSCFDAIQEVKRRRAAALSFHQLKWPDGIEFRYTLFVVTAVLEGQKYAQIDFGEDGNPIQVSLYKDDKICRRNLYDDRGFLSATILYENEQPVHCDYLMENGVWKLRYFYQDGHVEINSKYPAYLLRDQGREEERRFSRLRYDDISQVICEVLLFYLQMVEGEDIFCVAMHEQHTRLLEKVLRNKKLILSFFSGRSLDTGCLTVRKMVKEADYIVADSGNTLNKLKKVWKGFMKNSIAIPPYDSREDSGLSLQFNVQKVLVAIDGVEGDGFGKLVRLLGEYLRINENVQICLLTRKTDYDRKQRVLETVRRELLKAGMEDGWAKEADETISENNINLEESVAVKFIVEQCVDELSVSKCMREQRLFVDLREIPELYLQITAISIGIPQIVRTKTEFVTDGLNGKILKNVHGLPKALHYYLGGLKNWNQARIFSYELMKEYTTDKLLERWKEVMDSVGGDLYFTIGERRLE